jgi:hypothetical protein
MFLSPKGNVGLKKEQGFFSVLISLGLFLLGHNGPLKFID